MRMRLLIPLVGAATLIGSGTAWADHPTVGFSADIAGPVITIPAATCPKGRGAVALRTEYLKFSRFSDADLARFAGEGEHPHSVDYLLSPSLSVGYGLTDDLTVSARLPYLLREEIREAHDEEVETSVENHGDSQGVGDLTIFGQYRFIGRGNGDLQSAFLLGIKVPTGETDAKDREGGRFETEHQPGSGSWDPVIGVAASKRAGVLSLNSNLLYTFANGGAQDSNLGDRLHYNAAASYRFGPEESHHSHEAAVHRHLKWDVILEVNGEWQEKQKIGAVRDRDSGGHLVYLSPGMRLSGDTSWAATISVGIPVVEELNGIQHETDLRTIVGFTKGF